MSAVLCKFRSCHVIVMSAVLGSFSVVKHRYTLNMLV